MIADKQPGFDTQLAYRSQQLFKEIVNDIDYNIEYTQKGSIYLIESEQEWEVAENYVKQQVADGFPMRMMDRKEIHDDEPHIADDIIGGVEIECDAACDPMAMAYGLALAAQKNGAEILTFHAVKDIKLDEKGAVKSVVTDQGEILTKAVVNCAGVWAPHVGKMVGIDIPILPRQGQILVAESTIPVGKRKIVEFGYMMAKFGSSDYKRNVSPEIEKYGIAMVFEPTSHNNFLIGSSRAMVGYDTRVSIEIMRGLAERAIRFFPIMKNINVIRAYAGLRPYCPDHFPIVSPVEEVPGFYIAAGHEGDGIGLGPVTGKLISQMITGEETDLPVERMSFARFKKN